MRRMIFLLLFLASFSTLFAQTAASTCMGEKESTLRGQVMDLFSIPIRGVHILVENVNWKTRVEMVSDDHGRFCIQDVKNQSLKIKVIAEGYVTRSLNLETDDYSDRILQVGMDIGAVSDLPAYRVKGRIVDPTGKPVKGATVRVFSPLNTKFDWEVRTDVRGKYKLLIGTPGEFTVLVIAPNYSGSRRKLRLDEPQVNSILHTLNVTLTR